MSRITLRLNAAVNYDRSKKCLAWFTLITRSPTATYGLYRSIRVVIVISPDTKEKDRDIVAWVGSDTSKQGKNLSDTKIIRD